MKIDVSLAAVIGFLGICVTWYWATRKRSHEILDAKRKAAPEFLAKINECLFDAKEKGNQGQECVCQKSYAAFRLTLEGPKATALEECWNSYILALHKGDRCVECLECLHALIHKYTKTAASRSVDGCSVCAGGLTFSDKDTKIRKNRATARL